ncbi:MAG: FG-GAP-like repeat-containing protein, partial [Vicinamibacterales bacterium]
GVLFPNNAKIGSVVVLENQGRAGFTNRVLARDIARVSHVRAGDLDGDGDLDLAVAQFGYNEGQTRWMRNEGGWRFTSTVLQNPSGPINVEIADLDGDGAVRLAFRLPGTSRILCNHPTGA